MTIHDLAHDHDHGVDRVSDADFDYDQSSNDEYKGIEQNRAELFAALAKLSRRYPHWRIGQLVANAAGWADAEVWDAEDGELLAAVRGTWAHFMSRNQRHIRRNSHEHRWNCAGGIRWCYWRCQVPRLGLSNR